MAKSFINSWLNSWAWLESLYGRYDLGYKRLLLPYSGGITMPEVEERMTNFLKLLYGAILIIMIALLISASMQESILTIPPAVTRDPWFQATLVDCYFAFLSFFIWVCYREKSTAAKVIWFIAISTLGNIAMAIYVLIALMQIKPGEGVDTLFTRRKKWNNWTGLNQIQLLQLI